MHKTKLKGAAFEYFVRRVLLSSGFKPVPSDGFLIFDSGAGQMVHGLGQPHNTDVLVEPHIQTPFYNLSRLIVECKCYEESLGIDQVRNVLGLRTDINNFDIVTEEILDNRQSYRGKKIRMSNIVRYNYQVALASFNGFKGSAQALAATHRIPLISFASSIFASIRSLIFELDNLILNEDEEKTLNGFFHGKTNHINSYTKYPNTSNLIQWYNRFRDECDIMSERLCIGITNSGAILFLYKISNIPSSQYNDGYELHWDDSHQYWFLRNYQDDNRYVFELPDVLMNDWSNNAEYMDRREAALNLKERAMSNIVLYKTENGVPTFKIISLSNQFIIDARNRLTMDEFNEE